MKKSIIDIIKEEVEEYFSPTISDQIKRNSAKYVGRSVIWYGDPQQMIVVHKDQVHGMWGNTYDPNKLQYIEDLIRNSEDYIELECSYGIGDVVSLQEIIEHQQSVLSDSFSVDYDGHDEPYSIGDDSLDVYLGTDEIDDLEFIGNSVSQPEIIKFFQENKLNLATNVKSKDQLISEFNSLNPDEYEEFAFEEFIEMEENLKNAIDSSDGDLNKFTVQLRDGHHRVFGAINAGEEYVCLNLEKDQIASGEFNKYIKRVTTK